MSIKELRVGNWYAWESEGKKYYYRVSKEIFASPDYDIANFEPVLIDLDILKWAGFAKYTGKTLIYSWCEEYYVVIDSIKEGLWKIKIAGPNCNIEGGVSYVHELQNMMQDAGIEDCFNKLNK